MYKMYKFVAALVLLATSACGPPEHPGSGHSGMRVREQTRVDDFRPGDTIRYTTDGSIPDRTSPFVVYGRNKVFVGQTTIIKARLYRPGCAPSEVQQDTVYVHEEATQHAYAANPR